MVNWWGDIELSYKFAICLGAAIVVVFIAGLIKLWWTTRKVARDQKIQDEEQASKGPMVQNRNLGEADLFGVKALEKGYYGGVSQVSWSASGGSSIRTLSTLSRTSSNDQPHYYHPTTRSYPAPGGRSLLLSKQNPNPFTETKYNIPSTEARPSRPKTRSPPNQTLNVFATLQAANAHTRTTPTSRFQAPQSTTSTSSNPFASSNGSSTHSAASSIHSLNSDAPQTMHASGSASHNMSRRSDQSFTSSEAYTDYATYQTFIHAPAATYVPHRASMHGRTRSS